MFLKPFKVKTNTQLKSTERKNFKSRLQKNFECLSDDDIELIIPNKSVVNMIKLITNNNDIVIVHTVEKLPLIFECKEKIYPTVYLLWKFPNLLLTFTTYSQVFVKLVSGADLMIPGVISPSNKEGPSKYGKFEKGEIVAINLDNNKAPIAVGTTAHSTMDMYMTGGRGKCVNILHIYEDKLWSLDSSVQHHPPDLGSPTNSLQLDNNGEDDNTLISENFDQINIETQVKQEVDENDVEKNEDLGINSAQEMDFLVKYCFLKTLKLFKKELILPLLTSNFYRNHLMKSCPIDKHLDIKKSTFKKLNKFLIQMAVEGFIKISELQKGVVSITSIDFSHPEVATFTVDPSDKTEESVSNEKKTSGPNVTQGYIITEPVEPIFVEFAMRKKQVVSLADVRRYITEYVRKFNLQSEKDKRYIKPNEFLKLLLKTEESVTWVDLIDKVINSMTICHKITDDTTTVTYKGKIEPITMAVGTRSGNKKVTIIDNLEMYGIRINEFAKECQHGVAASTTISHPPGKKTQQMQIQGNQTKFIFKLLTEKYKIDKKYIRGWEPEKSKK